MNWLRFSALVAAAAAFLGIIVWSSGVDPVAALRSGFTGALGTPYGVSDTLQRMTPLLLSGLGVAVGLRAGLFNIGVEGQLLVGALAAAAAAILLKGMPGWLHITLCLAAGGAAGVLWALPAGLIKVWRGGHEVITTIMMNYIALNFTKYIAANPFKDPSAQIATTVQIPNSTRLPDLGGSLHINAGLILAVLLAAGLAWWMKRTVVGYELKAVGANVDAAVAAGVNVPRTIVLAMALSGAFAGLAGAVQVCGYEYRFYDGISPGYGFDALAVALIALASPLPIIATAFIFGALAQGVQSAQVATDLPKEIAMVAQGIIILVAAAVGWQRFRRPS